MACLVQSKNASRVVRVAALAAGAVVVTAILLVALRSLLAALRAR
jgi:hypothetical protein